MSEEIKVEKIKKKREKPEEFIGWKSDDGLLEVVDIHGKQGTAATFKVICHKCKDDKELFQDEYFTSLKGNLVKGRKPCGCANIPKWNKEQYLVLARRAAEGRFVVHGFSEEFHGQNTKLNLKCSIDGHKWTASIHNIMRGRGCPDCKAKYVGESKRTDEQEALDKCKVICETEGYELIGFPNRYKSNKSRFEYGCVVHGKQNVSYDNFVNQGTRCKGCWKEKQKELSSGFYGYYPERKDEQDFLYVLDFDGKYIKVGRSFDVERRIGKNELQKDSGISNILKLRILTATHQEIYDLEQEIHSELRERNFQHCVDWSKECFEKDCLFILNKLLDISGLEEVL